MSTQQDIYAAGSESHPPMLNKENYVSWSSCLLRYAKSRPNGKLIHNSIINGLYVRRMIPEPKADDQAIQTILLGRPEDIYAAVDSCETAQEIWLRNYMQQPMPNPEDITDPTTATNMALDLMAKAFKMNYSTPTKTTRGFHQTHATGRFHNHNIGNLNGYNVVQNIKNQVVQNAVQNQRVQNIGNQNGLIGVPGNANQNLNGNGNLVAACAKGNAAGHNRNQIRCYNCRGVADLDEIKEVNANCILMANLQEALTSGTQTNKAPIYDSDRSAEVHEYKNCYDSEIFHMFTQEEQYTKLLEPIPEQHQVPQNDNNVIFENLAIEVEKVNSVNRKLKETNADLTTELEAARFVGDFKSLAKKADESLAKQKALDLEIKSLLRAVVSLDIMSVVQKTSVVDT
nr:hypothetical protein [Tanacetum cinerariifolium]